MEVQDICASASALRFGAGLTPVCDHLRYRPPAARLITSSGSSYWSASRWIWLSIIALLPGMPLCVAVSALPFENPRALNVRSGTKRVHELRLMWRNTRMVVLCAISAALYAAVLVPFKVVPLIPGVTELRPANAIPVVCSFLFGPAAAWGSAIGNMIGDFFGGVGPGDIFGFVGNLVYGYIPYKAWNIIAAGESPISRSPRSIVKYVAVCLAASTLCADLVGWGDNMLALRPFGVLGLSLIHI